MLKAGTCWKTSVHLFSALVEPCTSEVSYRFIFSAPSFLYCCSCVFHLLQSTSKTLKVELMSHKCGFPEFCKSLLPTDQFLVWCENLVETSSGSTDSIEHLIDLVLGVDHWYQLGLCE
ncbi:hypothetical protein F2Q69_00036089 [Brassica cretica]|uniref:Uncharacterized protein n=1 Tax=Brassica cretica TaxID=69181 RepID=A0A8S9SFW1_BRACR|nr:hypothetical protein F2Q69_00036089 [Brassica cretica]